MVLYYQATYADISITTSNLVYAIAAETCEFPVLVRLQNQHLVRVHDDSHLWNTAVLTVGGKNI